MNDHFRISGRGLDIIKVSEGLRLKSYLCPAGVWTVGYGHTKGVDADTIVTVAQADNLLREDCREAEAAVKRLVKVPINQNQFDALVSFVFNVGADEDADTIAEGLGDSTLLRKLNGADYVGAALEFTKWTKAAGKILPGLVKRRKAEQTLFSEAI